jgi:hypothetical protein
MIIPGKEEEEKKKPTTTTTMMIALVFMMTDMTDKLIKQSEWYLLFAPTTRFLVTDETLSPRAVTTTNNNNIVF